MKTIQVNGKEVRSTHVVKTDQGYHPAIHVTVEMEGIAVTHVLTIGSVDEPLPTNYDQAALQKDLDKFRQDKAEHLEGKIRAKDMAEQVV